MELYWPTLPVAVIMPDGIAPPVFVGVAVGDMRVLIVKSNTSGE